VAAGLLRVRDHHRRHLAPGRVTDYFTKYEHGWHIAPTCTGADAIAAVTIAIGEAERLAGLPLAEALPVDPDTGKIQRIKLVTDNGAAFARFIATRPELLHIRTRRRSPCQNGVRERAFGSLKYEHLYRQEIDDLPALAAEAKHYGTSSTTSAHTRHLAGTDRSRSTATRACTPNCQTKIPEPSS
jgi:transposase InsO family protein